MAYRILTLAAGLEQIAQLLLAAVQAGEIDEQTAQQIMQELAQDQTGGAAGGDAGGAPGGAPGGGVDPASGAPAEMPIDAGAPEEVKAASALFNELVVKAAA